MVDRFADFAGGLESPFTGGAPIVPHDSTELAVATRSVWVGTAGNIVGITIDGSELSFANFGPGWLPGRFRIIKATGTSASQMIGVY